MALEARVSRAHDDALVLVKRGASFRSTIVL
jgi:hypothetical protein